MEIEHITDSYVKDVISWRYPYPYNVYNFPSLEKIKEQNWGIVNPDKEKEFYCITANEKILAFFRVQRYENYQLLSLGVCPEECGKGKGADIVKQMLLFMFRTFKKKVKLYVLPFNKRAIKCYTKLGFEIIKTLKREVLNNEVIYIEMELCYEKFKNIK